MIGSKLVVMSSLQQVRTGVKNESLGKKCVDQQMKEKRNNKKQQEEKLDSVWLYKEEECVVVLICQG